MPNWCNNRISITGDADKMAILVEKFKELETNDEEVMGFLLGKDDRPANYEEGGWYDYNNNKFGTKWDFKLCDINDYSITPDQVTLDVDTAWAPPSQFLETLCDLYGVYATISYFEPGMDFAGQEEYTPEGITGKEDLTYLEGVYKFDDNFWSEVEYRAEDAVDCDESLEVFKEQFLSYLTPSDLERVESIYKEAVENAAENTED